MTAVRSRAERTHEAALLAGVGGFLDAYVFLAHGGVFANAQTGNVVLFGVELASRHWDAALRHVPPILAFVLGILTVEMLTLPAVRRVVGKPTRVVLVTECVVFAIVGLLPASTPGVIITVVVAWAATLQVATFRKVGDVAYTTTFTTGNLRALVSAAFDWLVRGGEASEEPARALAAVVIAFAGGALVGGLLTRTWHDHAVLVVIPALLITLASVIRGTRRLTVGTDLG